MLLTTMPLSKRAGCLRRHMIAMGRPAEERQNALVSGNGTLLLGAMGQPAEETLLLQREELLAPQWKEPPRAPLIADYLPEIRRMILEGRPQEAAELADMAAAQRGTPSTLTACPSHPALVLHVKQPVEEARDYLFTLDMRTSLVRVQWEDGGVFTRETFASRADGLAALRMTAPGGRLNAEIRGEFPELHYRRGKWGPNDLPEAPAGRRQGLVEEDFANTGSSAREGYFDCQAVAPSVTVTHEADAILLEGRYAYERGGFAVAVRVRVQGGRVLCEDGCIRLEGADTAVLTMNAERTPAPWEPGRARPLLDALDRAGSDFDRLLKRHTAIHQPMFDRVEAWLGGEEEDYLLTTEELREKQWTSQEMVPAYMEALLDRGRFFLLNECGKFPPIYGHVNVNVNHQISSGNIASLPEMMESFFRWIEWQLPDARENAARTLGTRGAFLATHPDQESGRLIHFNRYWPHHYWISSTGWCLNPFLEHYYCTGDEEFLKNRLLPLYHEAAQMYEDFLTVRDEHGRLMFIPSYSPENFPSNVASMMNINAVMDISVCREVLTTLVTLGPKTDLFKQEEYDVWHRMLDELPPYLTGAHGELKEWAWEAFEERYDHRHASHLYGAYPGDEFQPELNQELYRAAFIANRMRALGNESCHGVMHRAQAAARLKDAWLVQKLLRFTLEAGYINDNFTTAHNPYLHHAFPDGQGALPTVLIESLLYSRPGMMELLPAKPMGSFDRGSLKGVSARTFCRVDAFEWNLPAHTMRLTLTSLKDQEMELLYRPGFGSVRCGDITLQQGRYAYSRTLRLSKDESVQIDITL